ncbi:MAG: hypothetical protein EXR99_09690 [Gemmataceae bacterium]|nr:hypothetical protein [Gemmataceae bacterium]
MRILLSCGIALLFFTLGLPAQENPGDGPKVRQVLKGSVPDEKLAAKGAKVIVSQKGLEGLWKVWKLEGKAPEVDFKNEIVLVETTRGSRLSLSAKVKDGDLQVIGISTRDLGPGFRFVIGAVSREGVKTVQGKEIAQE